MRLPIAALLLLCYAPVAHAEGPGLSVVEAVRKTLELDPQVRLQQQAVAASRGATEAALGEFDLTIQGGASHVHDSVALDSRTSPAYGGAATATTDTTEWELAAQKQLEWGTVVGPSVRLTRVAGTGLATAGRARVTFFVAQPLLRGRGPSAVMGRVNASRLEEEASALLLRHTIARRVANTAQAFHTYRAATDSVAVLARSEERAQQMLEQQKQLVQSGERPVADLRQVEAYLADAQAQRGAGDRALVAARQDLGLAMGIPWQEIAALPAPVGALPRPEPTALPGTSQVQALIDRARALRADFLAAEKSRQAAEVLRVAADRSLEPQLDLRLDLGWAGLTEGNGPAPFITPIGDGVTGPNAVLSLVGSYPIENRGARGALRQALAARESAAIAAQEVERTLAAEIASTTQTLALDLRTLERAEEALAAFREAVANEQKKLKAGLSTLVDVLQMEDRLTRAELNALAARLRVAQGVVSVRFLSGTLLGREGEASAVGIEELTTIPALP